MVWSPEDAHALQAGERRVCALAGLDDCHVEVMVGEHPVFFRVLRIVTFVALLGVLASCFVCCRRRCFPNVCRRRGSAALLPGSGVAPQHNFGSGAVGGHATPSQADLALLAVPNPPVPVEQPLPPPQAPQAAYVPQAQPAPLVYPTLVVPSASGEPHTALLQYASPR